MKVKTFEDLLVWKKSLVVVRDVYKCTENFPSYELYGLTSQIRRSAVSIPSNISEGCERESEREFIRFLLISKGSVAELKTQLIIAEYLGYIDKDKLGLISLQLDEITRMIKGLIKSLNNN